MPQAATNSSRSNPLLEGLRKLHNIKIGGVSSNPQKTRVKRRDLQFILSTLATLVDNGVSLPKALHTLAREASMKNYAFMLNSLKRKIETGESFSSALAAYQATFTELMVQQIRVGERSGKVAEALTRIAEQLSNANQLRSKVLKRLSYPMIVVAAGVAVVAFMLVYIVPTFQDAYSKARIPLPLATKTLIAAADFIVHYGWLLGLGIGGLAFGFFRLRKIPAAALKMDTFLLSLPLIGPWCRDVAVLQLMQVLGTMLESGFKVVDALAVASGSVANRAVRQSVDELHSAVVRGERLSRHLEKQQDLFPPIVSQLVIVGEQTGNLSRSTGYVCDHLEADLQRRVDIFVGAIEPILTITMALAICGILLAIYMPMFGMVDAVRAGG